MCLILEVWQYTGMLQLLILLLMHKSVNELLMRICVSDSGNGLPPVQYQAIAWTNDAMHPSGKF